MISGEKRIRGAREREESYGVILALLYKRAYFEEKLARRLSEAFSRRVSVKDKFSVTFNFFYTYLLAPGIRVPTPFNTQDDGHWQQSL